MTTLSMMQNKYHKTSNKCRGSDVHDLADARCQTNARLLQEHTELSEYQPYTSYVTATQTLSANTDNSSFFYLNKPVHMPKINTE